MIFSTCLRLRWNAGDRRSDQREHGGHLRRARQAGLKLVLVTGRVFFELIRVCETSISSTSWWPRMAAFSTFPGAAPLTAWPRPRRPSS
jgi:hypothetical protein